MRLKISRSVFCRIMCFVLLLGCLMPVRSACADEERKTIRVKVTATKKSGGDTAVSGATVSMYYGQGRRTEDVRLVDSFVTGDDGYAEIVIPKEYSSEKELAKLTFSASKVVAQGKGVQGNERDELFNVYQEPRFQLELHSETIDTNGNWLGKKLPVGNEKDVDLAFVIDSTGSMDDSINHVRDNITQFARYLEEQGLNLRMSVMEYRDIEEDGPDSTKLHYFTYSPWYDSTDRLIETLDEIVVDGGGDDDETPIDALDGLLSQEGMNWRSTAHKFAFLLTDADYKVDNSCGYESLRDVAELLNEENIMTSVISSTGFRSSYSDLYEVTGGMFADIYSSDFAAELAGLADRIIGNTSKELELHLQEPRLLLDYSVCYYARDKESPLDEHYKSIIEMMKRASDTLAKATDGHVCLNKVYIFRTNIRENFFVSGNVDENGEFVAADIPTSAMADIRIYTGENEKIQIRSSSYPGGFYVNDLVADFPRTVKGRFDFSKVTAGKKELRGIRLSVIDHNNWDLNDKRYADTVAHESGHYALALMDEYMNGENEEWTDIGRPSESPEMFGLMDTQWIDWELSKEFDYAYLNGNFDDAVTGTAQSYVNKASCEDYLSDLLGSLADPFHSGWTEANVFLNMPEGASREDYEYEVSYTTASHDRNTDYEYLILDDKDFIDLRNSDNWVRVLPDLPQTDIMLVGAAAAAAAAPAPYEDSTEVTENLADIIPEIVDDHVVLHVTQHTGEELMLYRRVSDGATGSVLTGLPVEGNLAYPELEQGQACELTVVVKEDGAYLSNTYLIERSYSSAGGYYYKSSDATVEGVAVPSGEDEYVFMTVASDFENGEYRSVNHGLRIVSLSHASAQGEVYSVAGAGDSINYSTISWFRHSEGVWQKLDTELDTDENGNIEAWCDYAGDGTYVLMAERAVKGGAAAVTDLSYTSDPERNGVLYLDFEDPNEDTLFYEIYYGSDSFRTGTEDGIAMNRMQAGNVIYGINLEKENVTAYVGIVAVMEDGARAPMSDILQVNTGEADRDHDSIPDWYCDQYLLWPKEGIEKNIADSDDDDDSYTNLEEYHIGSDPTDQDDPVLTERIAVSSVAVEPSEIRTGAGGSVTAAAVIFPSNASNQNIRWYIDDETVATVEENGIQCRISGVSEGSTILTAVTEDGGYTAQAAVTVVHGESAGMEETLTVRSYRLKENAGEIKYMSLFSNGTFRYNEPVTRYDALTALDTLFDFKNTEAGMQFSDVDIIHQEVTEKFSAAGIIHPDGAGRFRGEEAITEEELDEILKTMFADPGEWYPEEILDGNREVTRELFMKAVDYLVKEATE